MPKDNEEKDVMQKLMMLGENGWSWRAYNSYNTPKCKFCIKIIKRPYGQIYGYSDTPEEAMAQVEKEILERIIMVEEIKAEQKQLEEEAKENEN